MDSDDEARFRKHVDRAKELIKEGEIARALKHYKKAYELNPAEKLQKRIGKMEAFLASQLDSDEDSDNKDEDESSDMVHMGDGFYLYKELHQKLYSHQKECMLWMWGLYQRKKGGILGDDMGLGKTIQVIAFLSGMFDAEHIKSVLIVLPGAVMMNWQNEFEKWAPGLNVEVFHNESKNQRERVLTKIQRRGGVLLTTYGMIVTSSEVMAKRVGLPFTWDYVILDEGHKIKNPSNKCSKGLHNIPAKNRLILTGTPIQNNLKELWALYDWTHQGTLLGSAKTFAVEFGNPITRARQKDATAGEKLYGEQIATSLQKIIKPYFLRRTKAQVTLNAKDKDKGNTDPHQAVMPSLTRKNDLVVWVYLSKEQQSIYNEFSHSDEVKTLLNSSRSPLTALTVLKKICDHPRLLSIRQCKELGLKLDREIDEAIEDRTITDEKLRESAASRINWIDNDVLINESGKMVFLVELLDSLKRDGHRCLVFSMSRKVLDIISKIVSERGHKVARIDGTMDLPARQDMIKRFTINNNYSVFLLTTQVGGVGLTLTAADRVVIYDPSWNPATDAQAVDRAFRIGQSSNVVIYRLITCGSIEEKIYRRQIFKDSINKMTTGDAKNPYRYFTHQQLYELFILDNPRVSTTQQQISELHANRRKTDTKLDEHIAFLHTLDMFGISDHDLMFSKEAQQELGVEEEEEQFIQSKIHRAHQLIKDEVAENIKITEQLGHYPGTDEISKRRDANRVVGLPLEHPTFETPPTLNVMREVNNHSNYRTNTNDSVHVDDDNNGKDSFIEHDTEEGDDSYVIHDSDSDDDTGSRDIARSLNQLNLSDHRSNVSAASARAPSPVHGRLIHCVCCGNSSSDPKQCDNCKKPLPPDAKFIQLSPNDDDNNAKMSGSASAQSLKSTTPKKEPGSLNDSEIIFATARDAVTPAKIYEAADDKRARADSDILVSETDDEDAYLSAEDSPSLHGTRDRASTSLASGDQRQSTNSARSESPVFDVINESSLVEESVSRNEQSTMQLESRKHDMSMENQESSRRTHDVSKRKHDSSQSPLSLSRSSHFSATPAKAKKPRLSVNFTPRRKVSPQPANARDVSVCQEELIFSPHSDKPLVMSQTISSQESDDDVFKNGNGNTGALAASAEEDAGYSAFSREMNHRMNSTSLVSPARKVKGREEDHHKGQSLHAVTTEEEDSPIAVNRRQRRVIISDDEDDSNNDECADSNAREDSNAETSDKANSGNDSAADKHTNDDVIDIPDDTRADDDTHAGDKTNTTANASKADESIVTNDTGSVSKESNNDDGSQDDEVAGGGEAVEEEEEEEDGEEEAELDQEEIDMYIDHVKQSKTFYRDGDYQQAAHHIQQALKIYDDDEAARKFARKVQRKLKNSQ